MTTMTEAEARSGYTITAEQRQDIIAQVGRMNILSISGGRVLGIEDGIALPVSNGYQVRIHLTPMDDYTVERVFVRAGRVTQHGERTMVYLDTVGETAYRAGMFRSFSDEEW